MNPFAVDQPYAELFRQWFPISGRLVCSQWATELRESALRQALIRVQSAQKLALRKRQRRWLGERRKVIEFLLSSHRSQLLLPVPWRQANCWEKTAEVWHLTSELTINKRAPLIYNFSDRQAEQRNRELGQCFHLYKYQPYKDRRPLCLFCSQLGPAFGAVQVFVCLCQVNQ